MRKRTRRTSLFLATFASAPIAALADPGYYVLAPYDRHGLVTVEARYWTVKRPNRPETVWPEVAAGYGVTPRWTTLLLGSWKGSSQDAVAPSTASWQNVFLLTQGELPVDIALFGSHIRSMTSSFDHALEFGPLVQTDIGRTQLNLNVVLERIKRQGVTAPTALKYQWQIRHRLKPGWQAGLQGFGELGPWDDWLPASRQSHRGGPAIYAQLQGEGSRVTEVQAAMLVGRTYGRSGHMFSMRLATSY